MAGNTAATGHRPRTTDNEQRNSNPGNRDMSQATNQIGVVIHGITGRMGDVARNALCVLNSNGGIRVGEQRWQAVPIGVGRDIKRLAEFAKGVGLEHYYDNVAAAMDKARQ